VHACAGEKLQRRYLLCGATTALVHRRVPNFLAKMEPLSGTPVATQRFMDGIWKFEDLVAWKLAVQLQLLAEAYCRKPPIARDFKFRDQLADAAASGPRNLAEGFGRFYHRDFANFARIAKGSEEEVLNHFLDAQRKGYISADECDDGAHAARKALKAVNGLIRYLDATPEFGRHGRNPPRSQRKI